MAKAVTVSIHQIQDLYLMLTVLLTFQDHFSLAQWILFLQFKLRLHMLMLHSYKPTLLLQHLTRPTPQESMLTLASYRQTPLETMLMSHLHKPTPREIMPMRHSYRQILLLQHLTRPTPQESMLMLHSYKPTLLLQHLTRPTPQEFMPIRLMNLPMQDYCKPTPREIMPMRHS